MDTTFITILDLSPEAKILYSSDSIVDILGYTPEEVVNESVWSFFHPQELPFAKEQHARGVRLDKAAVLSYCQIRNREGQWIGCECCFSIVYNVLVCCTSIYRRGQSSQKRAAEAPIVRKMFSSSPKDPRYHMLSHLSSKFSLGDEDQTHEPRAALFLNRFTRTLTIMYATSGIEQIIGISSEAMKGRSFYYCIKENCLEDAVRCLESAKGNDSIAYLRFFFRDPRQGDEEQPPTSEDDEMTDITDVTEESSDAGLGSSGPSGSGGETSSNDRSGPSNGSGSGANLSSNEPPPTTRTDSEDSTRPSDTNNAIFGQDSASRSSTSSPAVGSPQSEPREVSIELEAVVSCTSDGLVVCLRRARPMLPVQTAPAAQPVHPYPNGMFAAPWAVPQAAFFNPELPELPPYPLGAQHPAMTQAGPPSAFQSELMKSIRDVAVFAWALVGINGSLADKARGHGEPVGDSQPPDGFPVWEPEGLHKRGSAAPSGYVSGTSSSSNDLYGDQGF
ncbi:hypothetical protein P154DRAFT_147462 [Amniculicola lignicola CBS 123094]|uniref:PAS domain-containing protein n=1 Tax=Amniculicola lignicola CBS 123094 TaxID=1392246 RepID=A0A6A5WKI7_9PLEO|nr:hypothetical protein P154DRAFT_147462 [Amniculicola lignicola CBS 123094]